MCADRKGNFKYAEIMEIRKILIESDDEGDTERVDHFSTISAAGKRPKTIPNGDLEMKDSGE